MSEMYPLRLKTRTSRTKYTFTWVIEDESELRLESQSGPTFHVNGEKWHLEFQKTTIGYGFRLYRGVSGFNVLVNATIKAIGARGKLIDKITQKLDYEQSEGFDKYFDLYIGTYSSDSSGGSFEEGTSSWWDVGEYQYFPNMVKFVLNLEFCALVTSIESASTDDELQRQAEMSLARDALAMFDNNINMDAFIDIRGDIYRGHKFILAARSSVFAKIFRESPSGEYFKLDKTYCEIKPAIMRLVFDFIYTRVRYDYSGIDCNGPYTSLSLHHAARIFKLEDLKKLVDTLIFREITPRRVGILLDIGYKLSDKTIKSSAVEFVLDNFLACRRENFLQGSEENTPHLHQEIIGTADELYRKSSKHMLTDC